MSLDSRYWGFVDVADIFGQPVLIYASRQMPDANQGTRIASWDKIRWERLFRKL